MPASSRATHHPSPAIRLVVNGWFWGQLNTGSGQYLHHLARTLPQVAELHGTLVLPAAPTAPVPAGWQVEIVPPATQTLGDNLAKVWFEQVSFPRACANLRAQVAWTPYWGAGWRQPCPTAVTVHDLIPLLLPAYRGGALQRGYTRLVAATARRAALLLTDSAASRTDLITQLPVPASRVQAVLLAADERFQPVTDAAELARVRARYGLPEQFILYLGGFDVRKNVAGLLRAYALLAAARPELPRLVVAGKLPAADTPFTPDPRRLAAASGVAARVHLTDWVDEADKPALYSLADLFVFPSLYEGYGLPVAEAAACGVRVVTADRSSLPEAAPQAWLVDPTDDHALAAAMLAALAAPAPPLSFPRRTWFDVARETHAALETLRSLPAGSALS